MAAYKNDVRVSDCRHYNGDLHVEMKRRAAIDYRAYMYARRGPALSLDAGVDGPRLSRSGERTGMAPRLKNEELYASAPILSAWPGVFAETLSSLALQQSWSLV